MCAGCRAPFSQDLYYYNGETTLTLSDPGSSPNWRRSELALCTVVCVDCNLIYQTEDAAFQQETRGPNVLYVLQRTRLRL